VPFTFNGCGTRYYGERDRDEDGSYVTTLWITFVWVPILPLASYRVIPTNESFNALVYRSEGFRVKDSPLCWPQIGNVYLTVGPILVIAVLLSWANARGWLNGRKSVLHNPRAELQTASELPAAAKEAPLTRKESNEACGAVLKLETSTFAKLDLHTRLSGIVKESAFTQEELEEGGSAGQLEQDAFNAYSLGYRTWKDPNNDMRSKVGKEIQKTILTESLKLTNDERAGFYAYVHKDNRLTMNAFDLGRRDARTSPCPF
jgi:hypothetical protein